MLSLQKFKYSVTPAIGGW